MILDSHMHVGDFPMFNVSTDRDGRLVEMRETEVATGFDFHPDNVVARAFPDGNIMHINTAIEVAERDPHIYLESSGMPMHSKVREAVEHVGPDRVLHGSATPFHQPSVELAKVRVSGLSTDLTDRMTTSVVEASRGLYRGEPGPDLPTSRAPVNAPRRRRSKYA